MTEADAILAVLAELGRAKEKWPAFGSEAAGMEELRRQIDHAGIWTPMRSPGPMQRAGFQRELTQIAAVAIRMLAGV